MHGNVYICEAVECICEAVHGNVRQCMGMYNMWQSQVENKH